MHDTLSFCGIWKFELSCQVRANSDFVQPELLVFGNAKNHLGRADKKWNCTVDTAIPVAHLVCFRMELHSDTSSSAVHLVLSQPSILTFNWVQWYIQSSSALWSPWLLLENNIGQPHKRILFSHSLEKLLTWHKDTFLAIFCFMPSLIEHLCAFSIALFLVLHGLKEFEGNIPTMHWRLCRLNYIYT